MVRKDRRWRSCFTQGSQLSATPRLSGPRRSCCLWQVRRRWLVRFLPRSEILQLLIDLIFFMLQSSSHITQVSEKTMLPRFQLDCSYRTLAGLFLEGFRMLKREHKASILWGRIHPETRCTYPAKPVKLGQKPRRWKAVQQVSGRPSFHSREHYPLIMTIFAKDVNNRKSIRIRLYISLWGNVAWKCSARFERLWNLLRTVCRSKP